MKADDHPGMPLMARLDLMLIDFLPPADFERDLRRPFENGATR